MSDMIHVTDAHALHFGKFENDGEVDPQRVRVHERFEITVALEVDTTQVPFDLRDDHIVEGSRRMRSHGWGIGNCDEVDSNEELRGWKS